MYKSDNKEYIATIVGDLLDLPKFDSMITYYAQNRNENCHSMKSTVRSYYGPLYPLINYKTLLSSYFKYKKRIKNRQKLYNKLRKLGRKL